MGKLHRLVIVGSVLSATLALGAAALASPSYAPRLAVSSLSQKLGSAAGVRIKFAQAASDDPTARLGVAVPKGYTIASRPAGTRIGSVTATVIAADVHRTVKSTGALTAGNLADFPTEAQTCTGTAKHEAVWTFTLAVSGASFRVPVFVDTTLSGPAAQFAAGELTMCFAAGDTKPGTPGRAPLGAKIVNAVITTTAISNPTIAGIYRWRASTTPYAAGTGSPDLKGIVEVQSLVPLPLQLTLAAKVTPSRAGYSKITLSGALTGSGQGAAGIFLVLNRGSAPGNLKKLGVVSTNRDGQFSTAGDVKQTGRTQRLYFQVTTTAIEKDLGLAGCQATTSAVPCIDATLPYNISSRTVAVTIPAR